MEGPGIALGPSFIFGGETMATPNNLGAYAITRQFLVHGNYYAGRCRNACIARWDAQAGRFDQFIPVFDIGAGLPEAIPFTSDSR